MSDKSCNVQKKTTIGGQALIEGVMMRGPHVSAMAVRRQDGTIYEETWETSKPKWYNKTPLIRGVFNFISMMVLGYKCLMKSSELAGEATPEEQEQQSKFEKWLEDKFGDKLMSVLSVVVMVVSLAISIGLFMFLPSLMVHILGNIGLPEWSKTVVEGIIKILIFVGYLFFVTRLPDIRRVYQYHGAEHKTIACYEAREPLEVENIKKYSRFHPRCGTSFLLIALVVSVAVNSMLTWDGLMMRVGMKLLLLPVVVGISFEVIRFAGKYSNPFTRILSAPGLWLQNLTTFEPDESQIAVAVAAMTPCIPENQKDDDY